MRRCRSGVQLFPSRYRSLLSLARQICCFPCNAQSPHTIPYRTADRRTGIRSPCKESSMIGGKRRDCMQVSKSYWLDCKGRSARQFHFGAPFSATINGDWISWRDRPEANLRTLIGHLPEDSVSCESAGIMPEAQTDK
ncbi:hypothetical protein BJX64DRAFT_272647 [Aspergillus heterothallicus]